MTLLDILIVLAFLLLALFGQIPVTVGTTVILVAAIAGVRVIKGERV